MTYNNTDMKFTDDQIYAMGNAARYAICYLRKCRQVHEGKISMTVDGCDPPYLPDLESIAEDMESMCALRDWIDDMPADFE